MIAAGTMLAHQVAAKAVRDAAFLSAWPVERLPLMVIATSVVVVAAVPMFSRLLARLGPRAVVPVGFLLSAAAHLVEWRLWGGDPWLAVWIYLHVAGLGALLLSGFWSYLSELFDAGSAKDSFGRIAAGGTLGGLAGGLTAERIAATASQGDTLLFLAGAHAAAALGLWVLGWCAGRRTTARATTEPGKLLQFDVLRTAPHLRTLALLVVLGTAGAGILDFLLKEQAANQPWSGAELQRFFAVFYTAIQLLTFAAQAGVGTTVRRVGLGRTISSLPAGLGISSALALIVQAFPLFVVARGVESVIRGSLYRSGYELLFVPMDPAEKRRTKTFLDVTCDRAGDALGAGIVQLLLLAAASALLTNALLGTVIAMALVSIWLGKRLDVMYRRVVERRLVGQLPVTPAVIGSEAAWTVVDLPAFDVDVKEDTVPPRPAPVVPRPDLDSRTRALVELRSGDRTRVEAALQTLRTPDALIMAQAVQLLAWDDVVAGTRTVLEREAGSHTGMLTDALLDPHTDFAIRRRIPRVLGTVPTQRALNGLLNGLDDTRFEVRYQCARAIERLTSDHPDLPVSRDRIFAVVERELSVPVQVWRAHRLIDRDEGEEGAGGGAEPRGGGGSTARSRRGTEHIYALLATVLPREPLTVAFSGLRSDDRALRSVALEYFDSVLPSGVRAKLGLLLE